jgi:DNA-binding NtrC family response regulator
MVTGENQVADSTIFLIEDDAAVRDALSISLRLDGLRIEVYGFGEAFLDAYTKVRSGCLLLNLSQPQMEGLMVQQELLRRNFPIPIIFMTEIGRAQDALLRFSLALSAYWKNLLPGRCFLKASEKQWNTAAETGQL